MRIKIMVPLNDGNSGASLFVEEFDACPGVGDFVKLSDGFVGQVDYVGDAGPNDPDRAVYICRVATAPTQGRMFQGRKSD